MYRTCAYFVESFKVNPWMKKELVSILSQHEKGIAAVTALGESHNCKLRLETIQ